MKIVLSVVVEIDPVRYALLTDSPLKADLVSYVQELVETSYYAGVKAITSVTVGVSRDEAMARLTNSVIKEKTHD